MRTNLSFRSLSLALMLFSASTLMPSLGYGKGRRMAPPSQKTAITSALKRELGRQTPDHVKVTSFSVIALDVRSNWALAKVRPQNIQLDDVLVLMHKTGSKWKIVTLGGNLHGSGKQYKVPRSLWRPWGLDA